MVLLRTYIRMYVLRLVTLLPLILFPMCTYICMYVGKEIPRRALPSKHNMIYYLNPENRGYLLTEAGQKRLAEGGMEGAYLHPDGRVAIPGKKTTLYTGIAPTKAEAYKEVSVSLFVCVCVCT